LCVRGHVARMNTNVWGPDAWSVLHGAAAAERAAQPSRAARIHAALGAVLQAFRVTLPCRYCRESFNNFLDTELCDWRDAAHDPDTWLFDLHNLVSDKLDAQNGTARARRPTIDCVRRKHGARVALGCAVEDGPLWRTGVYFALNDRADPDAILALWDALARLGADTEAEEGAAVLAAAAKAVRRLGVAGSSKPRFAAAFLARAAARGRRVSSRATEHAYTRACALARARACKHGSCR